MLLPYYSLLRYIICFIKAANETSKTALLLYPFIHILHKESDDVCVPSRYDALTGVLLGIEATSHGLDSLLFLNRRGQLIQKAFEKVSKIIKI